MAALALVGTSCQKAEEGKAPITKPQITIEGGRLTPEGLWAMGRIGSYSVSPDGTQVSYQVTYYSVEENSSNTQTAWVKGIALKLVVYDEVSKERSDAFRYCQLSCEMGNCQGCIRIPDEKSGKPAAPSVLGKTAKPNNAPAPKEEKSEE